MATSDKVAALQLFYLNKYNHELYVIMRLGGVILQQQLCRWLHNNSTDTTSNTAMVKKLEEALLIRTHKIGSNSLLALTYPVFQYFGVNRTVKINGTKIKRSSMIMEKYLRLKYYEKEPIELKKRLDKTSAISYMAICEQPLRLIQKYMPILQEKGWCIDGLKHEEQILYKRFDYHTKFSLYENYPPLVLAKEENELDLYNLECRNAFLSGIRFEKLPSGNEQLIVYADIYNIYEKDALTIGKLILDTQRTIEAIFADYKHDNFAQICINVFSHYTYNDAYEKKIFSYLCTQNEYLGNQKLASERINLVWFNTRTTLFSNIDPSSIV